MVKQGPIDSMSATKYLDEAVVVHKSVEVFTFGRHIKKVGTCVGVCEEFLFLTLS